MFTLYISYNEGNILNLIRILDTSTGGNNDILRAFVWWFRNGAGSGDARSDISTCVTFAASRLVVGVAFNLWRRNKCVVCVLMRKTKRHWITLRWTVKLNGENPRHYVPITACRGLPHTFCKYLWNVYHFRRRVLIASSITFSFFLGIWISRSQPSIIYPNIYFLAS